MPSNATHPSQSGSRHNRSAMLTFRLTHEIAPILSRRIAIPVIFFNFSFAFDTTHHELLLQTTSLFPPIFHNLLRIYLTDRTFHIRCHRSLSSVRPFALGFPKVVFGHQLSSPSSSMIFLTPGLFLNSFTPTTLLMSCAPSFFKVPLQIYKLTPPG